MERVLNKSAIKRAKKEAEKDRKMNERLQQSCKRIGVIYDDPETDSETIRQLLEERKNMSYTFHSTPSEEDIFTMLEHAKSINPDNFNDDDFKNISAIKASIDDILNSGD